LTDAVLRTLSQEFDALYADSGRPSIAPEYILRALLLQVFYSVRSERLLVEQIDYNFCSAGLWVWAWTMRLEPRGLFEEPRPAADFRCCAAVLCRSKQAC
jgi:hypothetical protein